MKTKLKMTSLKAVLILLFTPLSYHAYSQNEFIFQQASEINELVFNSTRDNNDLKLSKKTVDGKKFLLIKGSISDDLDTEIEKELIFFKSGETQSHPVGELEVDGEVNLGSIWNLRTGRTKKFSYIFIVDSKATKGTLHLGEYKVEVKSIDKNWPQQDVPRLIEVVSSEKLEKFEQTDQIKDATKENEYDIQTTYQPMAGNFLKVTIEVQAPESKNGEKENGKNYTFTPSQFLIADQENNTAQCKAFIRDYGDRNTFTEGMNSGALYGAENKTQLILIFQIGNSKGTYKIFHVGKEYSSFEVK